MPRSTVSRHRSQLRSGSQSGGSSSDQVPPARPGGSLEFIDHRVKRLLQAGGALCDEDDDDCGASPTSSSDVHARELVSGVAPPASGDEQERKRASHVFFEEIMIPRLALHEEDSSDDERGEYVEVSREGVPVLGTFPAASVAHRPEVKTPATAASVPSQSSTRRLRRSPPSVRRQTQSSHGFPPPLPSGNTAAQTSHVMVAPPPPHSHTAVQSGGPAVPLSRAVGVPSQTQTHAVFLAPQTFVPSSLPPHPNVHSTTTTLSVNAEPFRLYAPASVPLPAAPHFIIEDDSESELDELDGLIARFQHASLGFDE